MHDGACPGVFHSTLVAHSLAAEVPGSAGLVSNGGDSFQSFAAIRTRCHSIRAVMVRMCNAFDIKEIPKINGKPTLMVRTDYALSVLHVPPYYKLTSSAYVELPSTDRALPYCLPLCWASYDYVNNVTQLSKHSACQVGIK